MSCTEVMYQPYSPYFPYPQRPSASGQNSLFASNNCSAMTATFAGPTHHPPVASHPPSATLMTSESSAKKFAGMPKLPDLVDGSRSSLSVSDYSSGIASASSQASLNSNSVSSGISGRKLAVESSPSPNKEESPKGSTGMRSTERSSSSSSSAVASQSAASSLRDSAADAQYISANCVVFTYFSGDISSVVDEHFSRALNQQNYNSSDKSSKESASMSVPMSHRSFPPSFWNINHHSHQPSPQMHHSVHPSSSGLCLPSGSSSSQMHELYADAYHHAGALHAGIHHQNDPWHYTLSAASAAGNPYTAHHHHHHHRAASAAIHDLSYSSASNRFNAQYGSLLLQPASMRSTRIAPVSAVSATCTGFEKSAPDMSWSSTARYHHDSMNFAGHHGMDATNYTASAAYGAAMTAAMSGFDNQVQDTSKDLYWF